MRPAAGTRTVIEAIATTLSPQHMSKGLIVPFLLTDTHGGIVLGHFLMTLIQDAEGHILSWYKSR